jgi:hypothetical protein
MFSRTRGLRDVLKSPLPWLLGISFGADAFLQTGVITTLAPWLAKSYGVDALVVSRWNVVAMVCNGIGCLMVGALLNRGVRATWIGASGIVLTGIPALVIFSLQIGLWPSLVASWIFTFGSGLLVGMWALAPIVAPSRDSIGATSGLITQLTLIGVFLDRRCFSMHCKTTPATRSLCWCWRGWRSVWSAFQSGYGIRTINRRLNSAPRTAQHQQIVRELSMTGHRACR